MSAFRVPLFVRGELIEDDWVEFGGRSSAGALRARPTRASTSTGCRSRPRWRWPTSRRCRSRRSSTCWPSSASALDIDKNRHIQEAYEAGLVASNYPASILRNSYVGAALRVPARARATRSPRQRIGIDYLEGWVSRTLVRRPRAADPRVRRARAARAGRQRRARLGGDDHPQRDHAQRRDHQDPVERPAHRDGDRAHARRGGARTIRSRSTSRSPTGRAATRRSRSSSTGPRRSRRSWPGAASRR